jgi:DNA-binding MarR family transcriptional regulator
VSVVVRRLVDRGLVTRRSDTADKRRVQIELTPAGEKLLVGAPETIQVRLMEALNHLSPVERKQLAQLLSKWLDAAKISYASPPMMGEADEEVSGAEL